MRIVLFALMIILLPLRGWVSDAMATSMAVAQMGASSQVVDSAIKSRAIQADKTGTSGGFDRENIVLTAYSHVMASSTETANDQGEFKEAASDCAGHAGNAQDAATSDACGSCSACLTCHVSAIQGGTVVLQAFSLPRAAPQLERRHFASADTALSQKPPIS